MTERITLMLATDAKVQYNIHLNMRHSLHSVKAADVSKAHRRPTSQFRTQVMAPQSLSAGNRQLKPHLIKHLQVLSEPSNSHKIDLLPITDGFNPIKYT